MNKQLIINTNNPNAIKLLLSNYFKLQFEPKIRKDYL